MWYEDGHFITSHTYPQSLYYSGGKSHMAGLLEQRQTATSVIERVSGRLDMLRWMERRNEW